MAEQQWTFEEVPAEKALETLDWTFETPKTPIEKFRDIDRAIPIPQAPYEVAGTPYYSIDEYLEQTAKHGTIQEENIPLWKRMALDTPIVPSLFQMKGREVPYSENFYGGWVDTEFKKAAEFTQISVFASPVAGPLAKVALWPVKKALGPLAKFTAQSIKESAIWFHARGIPLLKYSASRLGRVLQGNIDEFSSGWAAQKFVKKFGSEKKAMEYVEFMLHQLDPKSQQHLFMKNVQSKIFDTRWREAAYEAEQILGDTVTADMFREAFATSTRTYARGAAANMLKSASPSKVVDSLLKVTKPQQKEALDAVFGTSNKKEIQALAEQVTETARLGAQDLTHPDVAKHANKVLMPELEKAVKIKAPKGIVQETVEKYGTYGGPKPPASGEAVPQFPINYTLPQARDPRTDISLIRYFAPTKYAMLEAEKLTKLPFFDKIYRPVMGAYNQNLVWKRPLIERVGKLFKGVDSKSQTRITHYLEGTSEKFKDAPLTAKEIEISTHARNMYNKLFKEFGIDPNRFLTEYSPRVREMGSFQAYLGKHTTAPQQIKFFAELERTGELFPREEKAQSLLLSYIHAGGKKKFLAEPWQIANKMLETTKNIPSQAGKLARDFLDDIYGLPAESTSALRQFQTNLVASWNKRMPGALQLGQLPADAIVNLELTLTYSGAMGFRPMTVIRNATQPFITVYPRLGSRWFSRGYTKALTSKGMAEARELGILYDSYLPIPYGEEMALVKGATSMLQKGLWAFRRVDSLNRAVAYHGMKERVLHFGEKFLKNQITAKQFITKTEIEGFHPTVIKDQVLPLLRKGNIKELAQTMGKHLAEDTQWIYRKANAPKLMRGNVGKLFGQFGVWPASYLFYLKQLGMQGTKLGRAKRVGRFLGMSALIKEVGEKTFGVDVSRWVYWNPLYWGGSPVGGALLAARDLIAGSEYDKASAKYQLKRWAALHIPNYLAIEGLFKAGDEYREEDAVKRGLGFTPYRGD